MLMMAILLSFFGLTSTRLKMQQIAAMSSAFALVIIVYCALNSLGIYDTLAVLFVSLTAFQATYLLALIFGSHPAGSDIFNENSNT